MVQWVRDLALSLLWCRFDLWSGNFQKPQAWPKKKKKDKKRIEKKKEQLKKKKCRNINASKMTKDHVLLYKEFIYDVITYM